MLQVLIAFAAVVLTAGSQPVAVFFPSDFTQQEWAELKQDDPIKLVIGHNTFYRAYATSLPIPSEQQAALPDDVMAFHVRTPHGPTYVIFEMEVADGQLWIDSMAPAFTHKQYMNGYAAVQYQLTQRR